jgi:hypothetical protein
VIFFLPWWGNGNDECSRVPRRGRPAPVRGGRALAARRRPALPLAGHPGPPRRRAQRVGRPLPVRLQGARGPLAVRSHLVILSPGIITIAGDMWTTYTAMADETVDRAVELVP